MALIILQLLKLFIELFNVFLSTQKSHLQILHPLGSLMELFAHILGDFLNPVSLGFIFIRLRVASMSQSVLQILNIFLRICNLLVDQVDVLDIVKNIGLVLVQPFVDRFQITVTYISA